MSALARQGTEDQGETPAGRPEEPAKRSRARRWALTIALVPLGVAAAAGIAAAITLTVRPHHSRPVVTHPLRGTVFGFRTGQCIDSAPNGIDATHAVRCAGPHQAEIYGAFSVPGHRWPGNAALTSQARTGCGTRLGSYLNPQMATSGLTESFIYPGQGAWTAGARTVICEIRSTSGELTGSVRAGAPAG